MEEHAVEVETYQALLERYEAWKALAIALDRLLELEVNDLTPTPELLTQIREKKERVGFERQQ